MNHKQYGRYPKQDPKYYPDTMVQIDADDGSDRMIRYGDLDPRYEWLEVTRLADAHAIFVRGMHWADEEPVKSENTRGNERIERSMRHMLKENSRDHSRAGSNTKRARK